MIELRRLRNRIEPPSNVSTPCAQAPKRVLRIVACHILSIYISYFFSLRKHRGGCLRLSHATQRLLTQGCWAFSMLFFLDRGSFLRHRLPASQSPAPGVVVAGVRGPALAAGLNAGDIIVALDDQPIARGIAQVLYFQLSANFYASMTRVILMVLCIYPPLQFPGKSDFHV